MGLFRACFSPRTPSRATATKKQVGFDKGVLADRWKQYNDLSKESTWGKEPVRLVPHHYAIQILVMVVSHIFYAPYPAIQALLWRPQITQVAKCLLFRSR